MDVATITIDPEVAREKIAACREFLRRSADAEVEAALAGYEELEENRALINLQETFRHHATFDDKGRPNLAIARADRAQVHVVRRWNDATGPIIFRSDSHRNWSPLMNSTLTRVVRWWPTAEGYPSENEDGWALVPHVPAEVRIEATTRNLRNLFVLWEVEAWSDRRLGAEPDYDPFLLRHLLGDLYVIEGSWDLTELERAIMADLR